MGVGFLWVLLSVRGIRVVGIPSGRWPWSLTRRVTSNSIQVILRAKNPTAASLLNISAASWQIGKLARTKIQIKRQVPSPPTTKLILDALIWPPQQPVKAHCRCQPCSCQAPTPPDGVSEEVKGFSPAKQESAQAPCRSNMASGHENTTSGEVEGSFPRHEKDSEQAPVGMVGEVQGFQPA